MSRCLGVTNQRPHVVLSLDSLHEQARDSVVVAAAASS